MTQQEKEERIELYRSYHDISQQEATKLVEEYDEIEAEYLKVCPEGCDPIMGPAVED